MGKKGINWWKTSFGEEEISRISSSIRNEHVSQGVITQEFEKALSEYLGVKHVVAVSSGSIALYMALLALDIKPGDEIVIPNRTWIATAHAAHLVGAKIALVDVEVGRPIIDVDRIESVITPRTKVIMPVHMNGRSANMLEIRRLAKKYNLHIVEDAAQAIASKNKEGYLGTQSDIGCFSLSVAKTIATGQGGFAVTNNDFLAGKMQAIRTHGVENVKDPAEWVMPGFNFRFTDILASVGLEQLKKLNSRVDHLKLIYEIYKYGLRNTAFNMIEVDIESGEVPVYSEFLVEDRGAWIGKLASINIETRPFYPDIDMAKYLKIVNSFDDAANSRVFSSKGLYLPSGPAQSIADIERVVKEVQRL